MRVDTSIPTLTMKHKVNLFATTSDTLSGWFAVPTWQPHPTRFRWNCRRVPIDHLMSTLPLASVTKMRQMNLNPKETKAEPETPPWAKDSRSKTIQSTLFHSSKKRNMSSTRRQQGHRYEWSSSQDESIREPKPNVVRPPGTFAPFSLPHSIPCTGQSNLGNASFSALVNPSHKSTWTRQLHPSYFGN